jgi:hypothetical protein
LCKTQPLENVFGWLVGRFHVRGLLIALIMEAARTSETLVNLYQTHGATTQKATIFVLTAVRTSNPTKNGKVDNCMP